MAVLEVKELTKKYGEGESEVIALDHVSFSVERGEFVAIIGATMDLGLLWDIADTFNGLMIIPNLIAVFMLSGTVVKLTREYFQDGPGKFGVETGKEN